MSKRRDFLKLGGLTGFAFANGGLLPRVNAATTSQNDSIKMTGMTNTPYHSDQQDGENGDALSIIGLYGNWANNLRQGQLPTMSFRRKEYNNLEVWRNMATQRLRERMSIPASGATPRVTVLKQSTYDGLHIEELSWQLPYGRPTRAILMKPANATGKLPAVLGFHDHAGNKYFGCDKITRTSDDQLPLMKEHQQHYYTGKAWANELARRGFVVLVPDAFAFGSRRVMLQDVPDRLRNGLKDGDPTDKESVEAYNTWAAEHAHTLAKSLLCSGTTWPGVFYSEDKVALDILSALPNVDPARIGAGGLSGGGLRTAFSSGLDARIKCAVNVGFTTTWADFMLNKSFTHTWMTYVPLLPNELDFPEIMGLRVPLPTLVLNDSEDQLYTLPEMKKAESMLKEIYSKANAFDNFRCSYYPGLHKFDSDMQEEAFKWFEKWLKV